MQTIYLDNASTSYPKAPDVGASMARFIDRNGMNVFRGGYAAALDAEETLLNLREKLRALYNAECAECAILTCGATYGLNMVIKGALGRGGHVLVSALEHNAVMRPLRALDGIEIEALPCSKGGETDPDELRKRVRRNTALVICTYASNVCGEILPIPELGKICSEYGVPFVVDASQAVGHMQIDCAASHIDALVFSAHKGLLGPQGAGAALLTRLFAQRLAPFMTGGTGSMSDMEVQPSLLPDKLEAGTPNLPGLYGFNAALDYYIPRAQEIAEHENKLTAQLMNGLRDIPRISLPGSDDPKRRVGVVSVDFLERDNADAALRLEREYGILTRCGLHCAPAAHRALCTFPRGTVRLSVGWGNTVSDVDAAIEAIRALA